jgi:hypothetical protein
MAARTLYDTALESVMALDGSDQRRLLQDLLKHLLGKTPRKGGAAKGGAAGGTGGGGSWWTAATKKASAVLAPLRDAENLKLSAAGKKKLPGTVAVVILSKLKEAGKVTKGSEASPALFPSDEELQEAFASYMEDYEPEDAKSTASKGSKTSSGPKFSELSPEEQKARRSEAAKKAAAARKANKAAKEAFATGDDEPLGATPAMMAAIAAASVGPADAAEAEEEPAFKERTIGKKKCLVMEIGTLTHVCDMEQNWLGVLKGTKIVKEGYSSPFEGDD